MLCDERENLRVLFFCFENESNTLILKSHYLKYTKTLDFIYFKSNHHIEKNIVI